MSKRFITDLKIVDDKIAGVGRASFAKRGIFLTYNLGMLPNE